MKFVYIFVLIAFAKAKATTDNVAGRIYNGQAAMPSDSYTFRFYSVENINTVQANISSGVAISFYYGLVSAQAVNGFELFYIGYDSIFVDEQTIQRIDRQNIIVNENFTVPEFNYNIAVVKFTNPVENYIDRAVAVPDFPIVFVLGYGYHDEEMTTAATTLQFTVAFHQTLPTGCVNINSDFNADASLCYTSSVGSHVSDGDQGGAVTDQGRTNLVGLVSYWHEQLIISVNIPASADFIDDAIAYFEALKK